MNNQKIDAATMENVEMLAQLKLTPQEREEVKGEMEKILNYVEKLDELDTSNADPLVHVLTETNVFREDIITNDNGQVALLKNAPKQKDSQLQVPRTI